MDLTNQQKSAIAQWTKFSSKMLTHCNEHENETYNKCLSFLKNKHHILSYLSVHFAAAIA